VPVGGLSASTIIGVRRAYVRGTMRPMMHESCAHRR